MNRCKATNRQGEQCGAFAIANSDYCFMHHPARAAQRREAQRRGGQARHDPTITAIGLIQRGLAMLQQSAA